MELKEKINKVLEVRKKYVPELKERLERAERLKQGLDDIKEFRVKTEALWETENSEDEKAEKLLCELTEHINNGIERFSRDYLSLALINDVNLRKQSKCDFFSSVTNIDKDIIDDPYYSGTITKFAARNSYDMPEGGYSVKISFKKPEDIVETVEKCINIIDPEYLKKHTVEFNGIRQISIKELEKIAEDGNSFKYTALRHLEIIVKNFSDFKNYFGRTPIILTDPKEIKTYTNTNNKKGDTDPDVEYYYKYLAVEKAEIFCQFYKDTGKAAVVFDDDLLWSWMSIYGDRNYDYEKYFKNADKEDAVIIVKRPISGVRVEDLSFCNTLKKYFIPEKMNNKVFYAALLNRGWNDNIIYCFADRMREFLDTHCSKIDLKIVDLYDKEAVSLYIQSVLEKAAENAEYLDSMYFERLESLERETDSELERLKGELEGLQEKLKQLWKGIDRGNKAD